MTKATLATALLTSLINKPKQIHIPEFDGDIYIRKISVGEQKQLSEYLEKEKEKGSDGNNMALSFVFGVCDKDGNLLFTHDDLDKINQIDFGAVLSVVKEINKLNGFDESMDDQEKN